MARRLSEDRFRLLVQAAIRHFIADGYRRAQIGDIAADLGVAQGTVYLYVESKEALFDLAARNTDSTAPIPMPERLPVPTPAPGSTLEYVKRTLTERAVFPALTAALADKGSRGAAQELRLIAEEIYDLLARNREGLKLLDRCAPDYPELGEVWFSGGRTGLTFLLEAYLRHRHGSLRPIKDFSITARLALEVLVLWAVHRHFDPHPQAMDEPQARAEAVEWVGRALVAAP